MTKPKFESSVSSRLMESAKSLFFKYGIRKVSIVEICREAGVSKMSFYRHFKDKDHMAIEVLDKYFRERMETFESILREDISFEDKLFKIAAIKGEQLKSASNELIRDVMSSGESVLGKFITELTSEQIQRTREIFVSFQKSGHIRKDVKVDLIMYIIEHLWRASHDEKLMAVYDDRSQLFGEMFRAVYYGILPPHGRESRTGRAEKY